MFAELALSSLNERRLGPLAGALHRGVAGHLFRGAKLAAVAGLAIRPLRRTLGPPAEHAAAILYLAAGLAFRYAWVMGGKASAADDEAVARMAREGGSRRA